MPPWPTGRHQLLKFLTSCQKAAGCENKPHPLTIHRREEMKTLCLSYKPEPSNARGAEGAALKILCFSLFIALCVSLELLMAHPSSPSFRQPGEIGILSMLSVQVFAEHHIKSQFHNWRASFEESLLHKVLLCLGWGGDVTWLSLAWWGSGLDSAPNPRCVRELQTKKTPNILQEILATVVQARWGWGKD